MFKKIIQITVTSIFLLTFMLLTSIGIWFFQGGDLRDLMNGCYIVEGCTK